MLEAYRPSAHPLLGSTSVSEGREGEGRNLSTTPRARHLSAKLFGAAVALFGVTAAATTQVEWSLPARVIGGIAYGSGALLALAGVVVGIVSGANRDALDEIRHAELCFSLARAIDGKGESPCPFPEVQHAGRLPRARGLALAKLAVDSLIDGALHEGVSARVVAKLAKRCEVPAVRAMLKEIAADEGRHAAHGWDVVRWCFAEASTAVAPALLGAIELLPKEMRSILPAEAAGGAWERWGVPGRLLEQEEYRAARARVVASVRGLTVSDSRAA